MLGLPHGASGQVAAQLPDDVLVVDLGADHRLESASDWEQFYGSTHAGTWPYGLPELIHAEAPGADVATAARQRDKLPGTRRIAVPGCNVTAVTLGLQPGVAAGVVEPTDIVAVLANGYSGAGKALKPHLLASEALGSAQPYGVGGTHRHIPEIQQNLRAAGAPQVTISFTPTLVPMARGILATVTAPLVKGVDPEQVRAAWEAAYADEPFVHLLPEGQWPSTAMTLGANTALRAGGGRRGRPPGRHRHRHRQPRQGDRRRRDPVHEPRPRPAGDRRPHHRRSRTMTGGAVTDGATTEAVMTGGAQ